MTDIVERLRGHLQVIDTYPRETRSDYMAGFVQSVRMAADEIEKLRAQVVSLQSSLDAAPEHTRLGKKKTPDALGDK